MARPLFLEFPTDADTYNLGEEQFMLGPAVMVCPVLEEVRIFLRLNGLMNSFLGHIERVLLHVS